MGHTGPAAASPPGSSTRSCTTHGRFQHMRVTVSPNPLGWRSLLLPTDVWRSLQDWISSSRSLYSTPTPKSWFCDFLTSSQILVLRLPHYLHAECCAPVWCRSAHTLVIDTVINDTLRIVTGCLRPTPADNLSILADIQPAELHCNGATLSLGRRAMEPGHLLHSALTARWVQMHGASNQDTHLYSPQNNSAVHLTATTYARRIGRIINGMGSGRTTPQGSAFSF